MCMHMCCSLYHFSTFPFAMAWIRSLLQVAIASHLLFQGLGEDCSGVGFWETLPGKGSFEGLACIILVFDPLHSINGQTSVRICLVKDFSLGAMDGAQGFAHASKYSTTEYSPGTFLGTLEESHGHAYLWILIFLWTMLSQSFKSVTQVFWAIPHKLKHVLVTFSPGSSFHWPLRVSLVHLSGPMCWLSSFFLLCPPP